MVGAWVGIEAKAKVKVEMGMGMEIHFPGCIQHTTPQHHEPFPAKNNCHF